MDTKAKEFFTTLLTTPSPSGYEGCFQRAVRDYITPHVDSVESDFHGNLIAAKNVDAPIRVMLAGHADQIGMIVLHVDDDGYVYVKPIGGWDPIIVVGQRAKIWTNLSDAGVKIDELKCVRGVFGKKPIHMLTDEERKRVPKLRDLWLDVGASSREEALELFRIGDPITLDLDVIEMPNDRICAPAMDDKAGAWVVIEAVRRAEKEKLDCGVFAVATVQEELGLRGARTSAYGIDPHIGIAVDVTFATDCPTMDKKDEGDIKLGLGPVIYRGPNMHHRVVDGLIAAAEKAEIKYQLAAEGRATGTDANAMQVNRSGVAAALLSVPNRYMHSPIELISLEDLDQAADVLARFVEALSADIELKV